MSPAFEQAMRAAVATHLIEIARYIEAHADEPLTLASLAEIAGLSASRLQRTFKQAFGISPKIYQDACV